MTSLTTLAADVRPAGVAVSALARPKRSKAPPDNGSLFMAIIDRVSQAIATIAPFVVG